MIVTTTRKGADVLEGRAQLITLELEGQFVPRKDVSIEEMISFYKDDVLVIGKGKTSLYSKQGGDPFFYHPNSAMFRVKQYQKTNYDPLVAAADLSTGMSFLDCTLGLASDSLVAQLAVGETGHVTGLEANQILAWIVRTGLQSWQDGSSLMINSMRRIEVIHAHHSDYLPKLAENSYDVVYFDPMFEQHISSSTGIRALKQFACHDDLSDHVIEEALRIARSRVVLKDHYASERFERFGFQVIKRQHAAFHYGNIEIKK
ncbi:class I SAM-dependent methyltransferase [Alkalihalobacillus sp. MEB130]|uniref:class I SAM-dependent methyltransferase n=1 Tax=Alkalihalobacillus sp. MEB130 TaxID=2976704 RepID=UPI0028DE83B4|nr:class I SAM-dependent methyltransferase [Alkalihalobacillus sp. MEB130]MDT8862856.1 class I SAM-dependent methyltransferase [Alkalihalobacillus sp. MEB130]